MRRVTARSDSEPQAVYTADQWIGVKVRQKGNCTLLQRRLSISNGSFSEDGEWMVEKERIHGKQEMLNEEKEDGTTLSSVEVCCL